MCGINGCFGNESAPVERMNEATRHRGPDRSAALARDGVALGSNRLAIVGLGEGGNQPMETADGRYAIVFNGEIYNYKELREELKTLGAQFRGNSDTEVLLEGYKHWGEELIPRLRGMWGFAIHDAHTKEVLLSRDPFGIKPLYIYDDGMRLVFSSEIRGLLAHPDVSRTMDLQSVEDLFLLGYILAPRTILAHARSLLPGESVVYGPDRAVVRSRIERLAAPDRSAPTDDELERTLRDSVEAHLLAEVPVGLFFSGGTDSTAIAVLLKELGVRMKAYHLAVEGRGDTEYAEAIAAHTGIDLATVPLTSALAQESLRTMASYMDQPLADTSLVLTQLIAKRAAADVKVVLSGEGGDELFAGYSHHRRTAPLHLSAIGARKSALTSLIPLVRGSGPATEAVRSLLRRLERDPLRAYVAEKAIGFGLVSPDEALHTLASRLAERETPDQGLAIDRLAYLPDDLLLKIDMATMAHSIEGRVPLLDREVLRLIAGAPLAWKDRKAPLRRLLSKHLPAELTERPKSGFSLPLKTYFFDVYEAESASIAVWWKTTFGTHLPHIGALMRTPASKGLQAFPHAHFALYALHAYCTEHRLHL